MGLVHVSKASSRDAIWDAAGCATIVLAAVLRSSAAWKILLYLSQIFQILSRSIDRLKRTEQKEETYFFFLRIIKFAARIENVRECSTVR